MAKGSQAKSTGRKPRASSSFVLEDRFDQTLAASAAKRVGELLASRAQRTDLDDLVLKAIKAANACASDMTPQELAVAVNAILKDLVAENAIGGVLPSDDRISAVVKQHITAGAG